MSSKIEWTEHTWNPVIGCSIVSPGCTNCYAMRMAARLDAIGVPHYAGTTKSSKAGAVWTGKVALATLGTLNEPLRRKKPTTYFVNSMGDLFHEDVPDEWIDRVFAVMALAPQHTFQVLSKRSARMRSYFTDIADIGLPTWVERVSSEIVNLGRPGWRAHARSVAGPLPNVWLGVSAERQQEADERIPDLLATPAAVRFISAEPLLGPIELTFEADVVRERLHWVIVGGESGVGARPMHLDWVKSIRDQCFAAGVPFFFKQWGEWHSGKRIGKKAAGRLLDGREYNGMPPLACEVATA